MADLRLVRFSVTYRTPIDDGLCGHAKKRIAGKYRDKPAFHDIVLVRQKCCLASELVEFVALHKALLARFDLAFQLVLRPSSDDVLRYVVVAEPTDHADDAKSK
jgi:hypothetical protein